MRKILIYLILIHLILVTYSLQLRSIFINVPIYRDIIPILLSLYVVVSGQIRFQTVFDKLIGGYLIYSVFYIIFWSALGENIVSMAMLFRNHFMAFVLYYVSRRIFMRQDALNLLYKFISFTLIIMIASAIFEYFTIKVLAISPFKFFWYDFVFRYDDRYIGNLVGGRGYILPEVTPILGILGFPHATSALLVSLIGFYSLPFAKKIITLSDGQYFNLSIKFALILFASFLIIFFVLKVRTSMVIFLLLFTVVPIFISGKNIYKIFLFVFVLMVLALSNEYVISSAFVSLNEGFSSTHYKTSSFGQIISVNPITKITSAAPLNIIAGTPTNPAGSELRFLTYTLQFGLIWFILFTALYGYSLFFTYKLIKIKSSSILDKKIQLGILFFLLASFIDMGHYARVMWYPMVDIFAILCGVLSSYEFKMKFKQN